MIGVLVLAMLGALGFFLTGLLTNDRNTGDLEPVAVPSVDRSAGGRGDRSA